LRFSLLGLDALSPWLLERAVSKLGLKNLGYALSLSRPAFIPP